MRDQWAWMTRFFARCTDSKSRAIEARLQVFVPEASKRRPLFESAIAEASRRFGQPKIEPDVLYPADLSWEWEVPAQLIEAAVDFLARGEPWALHKARPASLVYSVSFKLRNPVSGAILPHQTSPSSSSWRAVSRIIGGIGPNPWLYPHFVFPFPRVNRHFLSYLALFTADLPFRLAPRHFRSVRPATTNTREHIGFLSPEDDDRIRRAQRGPTNPGRRKRGAA